MKLFQEETLDVQDRDLRTDHSLGLHMAPEEPNEDEDLAYDDDDLGENTEVTPLGDDIDEDDLKAIKTGGPLDDEDDDLAVDDDEDLDLDEDPYIDDDDEIVDITTSQQNDPNDDDDDLLSDDDDDDDLLFDDEEVENPDAIPATPLVDDEDDDEGSWASGEDDDDLLDDDDELIDDEGSTTETNAPQSLDTPDSGVSSRRTDRQTGRMLGHEPGIPGFGNEI